MPTLSNNFGANSIAGTIQPVSSLLTSKFQVTPNSSTIEHFFPFTDLQFSPADASNREIATARVPAIMHCYPGMGKVERTEGEGVVKNVANGRESYPADEGTFKWAKKGEKNYEEQREARTWFGSGMVNHLWGTDHLGMDTNAAFEQVHSEEEAVKAVADNPTLSTVAWMVTPRAVKFFYHDSMIRQIVARMRELIESLGGAQTSVCFMGLGDVEPNKQAAIRTKSGRARSNTNYDAGKAKVNRPTRVWNAGTLGWKGGRHTAKGSIYIPMDYVPYSTLKRTSKYNHIVNQLGLEWMSSLAAVGSEWKTMESAGKAQSKRSHNMKERLALLNLFVSSLPSFGTTDSPAPTDAMLDEGTVAAGVRTYLTMPFSSAYTNLDVGLLANLDTYTDEAGNVTNEKKIFGMGALDAFEDFLKNHFIFSVGLACMEARYKLALYPAVLMYEGGPRPEHVQQRMLMNFRPDRDYGGGGLSSYTLLPRVLNPGETRARVPTLMYLAREAAETKEGAAPNTYLGPRDPVIITDVKTSQFFGDRAETIIDDEFYYASPIITREGTTQSTYRNYRTINIVNISRPPFFTPGSTTLGSVLGMCAHHGPVSGPVYEQVLGEPWYHIGKDLKREVMMNNRYDDKATAHSGRATARAKRDKRASKMLNGQGHDEILAQNKALKANFKNPQARKVSKATDTVYTDTVMY